VPRPRLSERGGVFGTAIAEQGWAAACSFRESSSTTQEQAKRSVRGGAGNPDAGGAGNLVVHGKMAAGSRGFLASQGFTGSEVADPGGGEAAGT